MNTVQLIDWYGGDKAIARAAWTSTQVDVDLKTDEQIRDLIVNKLWNNGSGMPHRTPFERGIVEFNVTCDMASHIHIIKHRHLNVNGECLDGDTLITFVNKHNSVSGKTKIRDIFERWSCGRSHQKTDKDAAYSRRRISNMRIRVFNEKTREFTYSHIKDVWKTGTKKIYEITLRNGKKLMCSKDHPVLTDRGWVLTGDLSEGDLIACNGKNINIEGRPWTFRDFFDDAHMYTRKKFAELKNIKYELCKKWGYIFNIEFMEYLRFQPNRTPWNKGVTGYSINISEEGAKNRKNNVPKGSNSHFWRGGISTDRERIGAWTTGQSKRVHEKFCFTCQKCGKNKSVLHAHHIIPVCHDPSKAYDFDNLITVCRKCHGKIHSSVKNEEEFAKEVLGRDFIFEYDDRLKNRCSSNTIYYSDVISVMLVKEEECYDIEILGDHKNFVANGIVTHNSARYKEIKEDRSYIPHDWLNIECSDQNTKAYYCEKDWDEILKKYTSQGNRLYHQCLSDLAPILGRKRAKESARFFKTYNSQITLSVMTNMSCFYNFFNLRHDDAAQLEIREIAAKMRDAIKSIEGNPFKHTMEAFGL
jgi:thymidylate synthase (FAD)